MSKELIVTETTEGIWEVYNPVNGSINIVVYGENQKYWCSCKSFKYNHKKHKGKCKHIKRVKEKQND